MSANIYSAHGRGQMTLLRVQIVDDYPDCARIISLLIQACFGCQVRTCTNSTEAEQLAIEFRPHVIFLDLGMPRLSGFKLAEKLRQNPSFAKTILVALTGLGGQATVDQVWQSGFNFYLLKPAAHDEIERILFHCNAAIATE